MNNTFSTLFRCGLTASALFLGFLASPSSRAADTDDKGTHYSTVPVPAGYTKADVRDIAVATLIGREWTIQSKADDSVVGHIQHRGQEAIVTLLFDDKAVQIYCQGWKIDKTTLAREKPELPTRWLRYIEADLIKSLGKKPAAS